MRCNGKHFNHKCNSLFIRLIQCRSTDVEWVIMIAWVAGGRAAKVAEREWQQRLQQQEQQWALKQKDLEKRWAAR